MTLETTRKVVLAGLLVASFGTAAAFVTSGCAKQPSLTVAAAPAPAAPAPLPPTAPVPPVAIAPVAPAPPAPPPVVVTPPAPAPVVAARPAAPPSEYMPNEALRPVHFDFDKADLRTADVAILEASVRWLKDNPNHLVLIEGHCDPRGTPQYNTALGERRARAVMTYLLAQGIGAARVTTVSYGEERPLCHDESQACWARNRRAMFLTRPQ
jgi:peptidoglycan-associated lipoprotein